MNKPPADAFARVLAPHLMALYAAAYRLTGNRSDAEDLCQEVCLRAYGRRVELGALEHPRAWLLKVQYRVFIDGARRRRRSPLRELPDAFDADALTSPEPGPDDLTEATLTERRLSRAWVQLEREQRALLALQAAGYTLAEIESVTGLSTDVLKARLHRARVRLGKLLAKQTPGIALALERTT
jgi:RNA polymerase sigma-70 factor (ECF subfamily)